MKGATVYPRRIDSRLHRWLMLVVLAALLLVGSAAEACPTCKDGLAGSDPARAAMVRGYFWSIVFMMSMPFLILAGLGSYFYLEVRRARRLQLGAGQPSSAGVPRGVAVLPAGGAGVLASGDG